MVPSLCNEHSIPEKYKSMYLSRGQLPDAPVLPLATMEYFMVQLKPDFLSPLFSPFTTAAGHKGMPPTVMLAAGLDPLRDDAVIYDHALREAGVKSRLKVYPGLPHSFWSYFPMLSASKQFELDTVESVKWLLDGAP